MATDVQGKPITEGCRVAFHSKRHNRLVAGNVISISAKMARIKHEPIQSEWNQNSHSHSKIEPVDEVHIAHHNIAVIAN